MSTRSKVLILTISLLIAVFAVIGGLNVHAATTKDGNAYKQVGVYSEVLSRIRSEYVTEPNLALVTNGALHGLLESLDANSSYLAPDEYAAYKQRKNSPKGDIGATISKRFGYADVVSVLPNTPAAKAGLQDGDIIEAIGGKSTRELSVEEVHNLVAGNPGTTVEISVVRPRKAEPDKLTITRELISVPAPQAKMLENNTGYIKANELITGSAQQIASRIKDLEHQGAKKLILDLRDCSSGDEAEGAATANLFLDHGELTYLSGQKYPRKDFNADPKKAITKLPLVVLVNNGTAGPAEIVASAVLDNARGDVLGDKTFGDGTVQRVINVPGGAALVLSVAKYYTPNGKAIQDDAVSPNIEVATNPDQLDTTAAPAPNQPDVQLQRALTVLKNKAS